MRIREVQQGVDAFRIIHRRHRAAARPPGKRQREAFAPPPPASFRRSRPNMVLRHMKGDHREREQGPAEEGQAGKTQRFKPQREEPDQQGRSRLEAIQVRRERGGPWRRRSRSERRLPRALDFRREAKDRLEVAVIRLHQRIHLFLAGPRGSYELEGAKYRLRADRSTRTTNSSSGASIADSPFGRHAGSWRCRGVLGP